MYFVWKYSLTTSKKFKRIRKLLLICTNQSSIYTVAKTKPSDSVQLRSVLLLNKLSVRNHLDRFAPSIYLKCIMIFLNPLIKWILITELMLQDNSEKLCNKFNLLSNRMKITLLWFTASEWWLKTVINFSGRKELEYSQSLFKEGLRLNKLAILLTSSELGNTRLINSCSSYLIQLSQLLQKGLNSIFLLSSSCMIIPTDKT